MRRLLAILVATTAAPAVAADFVEPVPPPPVAVAPAWTGLYLGGQAGYGFHGGGSGGIPGTVIRIPGIPATPGTPGTPGTPATPGTPGTPEIPATPGIPGTEVPPVVDTFSFACAGAATPSTAASACVFALNGAPFTPTEAELAAAIAASGQTVSLAGVGSFSVVTPGAPGAPPVPGTPGIPATPATPGTPGTPGTPPTPATPGVPERTIDVASRPGVERFASQDDGFAGGVHIGYDREIGYPLGAGSLVLGAVADLSHVDVERFGGLRGFGEEISVREELDYLATLRARAGLAYGASLFYATGGLAFGRVETSFVNTLFDDVGSGGDTRVGYAVGGGVDVLVSRNVSLGVEYLYTDLGDGDGVSRRSDLGAGSSFELRSNEDFDFHTVRAKVSFRFD